MLFFILATCFDISGFHSLEAGDRKRVIHIRKDERVPLVFHATWYTTDGRPYFSCTMRYENHGRFIQSVSDGHEKVWRFVPAYQLDRPTVRGQRILWMIDNDWQIVMNRK